MNIFNLIYHNTYIYLCHFHCINICKKTLKLKTTKQTVTNTTCFAQFSRRKTFSHAHWYYAVNYSSFLYRTSSLRCPHQCLPLFTQQLEISRFFPTGSSTSRPETRIMTDPLHSRGPKINILCVFKPPGMCFSDHKFLSKAAKGYKFYTLSIFIAGEMKRISAS